MAPAPRKKPQPKKNRTALWVTLIVAMVVLSIGGVIAYKTVFAGNGAQTNGSNTAHVKRSSKQSIEKSKKPPASSSATSETSKSSQSSLNETKVRADIENTVGRLSGDNSAYVSFGDGTDSVSYHNGRQRSASSIKLFIMVVAYRASADGNLDLNDQHELTEDEKVAGTGVLQSMPAGTELSYTEIIEHMIDDSDNTAANIMIDSLGGVDAVNDAIQELGVSNTTLQRKMLDTDALQAGRDNYTSVNDMGKVLTKIYQHKMVSSSNDSKMLAVLSQNNNHTKLPSGLPSGATVYNKTGEYGDFGVQNDAAIVIGPNGKAFIAVVMCQSGNKQDQVSAMNQLGLDLYQQIVE